MRTAPRLLLAIWSLMFATNGAFAVSFGTYTLGNHPDGNQNPPPYGLRLDGLLDPSSASSWNKYTFDVTGVTLNYTSDGKIHIFGNVTGGKDTGNSWTGIGTWALDFLYSNVIPYPGDDDAYVLLGSSGTGTFNEVGGLSRKFDLRGKSDGNFAFRFGDETDDLGHRDFAGLSGWGWLDFRVHGTSNWYHRGSDDFIFTAERVPDNGTTLMLLGLAILGVGALAGRTRRSAN